MVIVVSGTRTFDDYSLLEDVLNEVVGAVNNIVPSWTSTVVYHGGAQGADSLAARWCGERVGVTQRIYRADWNLHGDAAGPLRTRLMIRDALEEDLNAKLVAFWDGQSPGTKHAIDIAKQRNMKLKVIRYAPA